MRVFSSDEMSSWERYVIDDLGVPAIVLMENAAIGVADVIGERFRAERVLVVCGPGNNGGDGLAVARHLLTRGYDVAALLWPPDGRLSGDAETQLEICRRLRVPLLTADPTEVSNAFAWVGNGLVVDGLFGTGLSRELTGEPLSLVERINASPAEVVSIDVPSGLEASSHRRLGASVEADVTVTFAALKTALVLPPAADLCGEIVVADLGVPFVEQEAVGPSLHLLTAAELSVWLEARGSQSHKGSHGHLLVIAGSRGMGGAGVLACRSAHRMGAGLVTLATAPSVRAECAASTPETMTLDLGDEGGESAGDLGEGHLARLLDAAGSRDALVLGPGLGQSPESRRLVHELLAEHRGPTVIDADGLNVYEDLEGLVGASERVLTPHPGELARLLGCGTEDVQSDRLSAARAAASRSGCVVVLKGNRTVIAEPEGAAWINPTGGPGLATAGTGDVLAGAIGSLLAQGLDSLAAAQLGVFVHGSAGDIATERLGERSVVATDVIESLPIALRRLDGQRGGRS